MKYSHLLKFPALGLLTCAALIGAQPVFASPSNIGPPVGAIFDLNGVAIDGAYHTYTVDFTAALSSTDITFALRNDPSYTSLTNVSVVDTTTGSSTNLIVNGTFLGSGESIAGWTYANVYGAGAAGVAENGYWYDGAIQAYDAVDQFIGTTAGNTYQISFDVKGSGDPFFSDLSTNGDVTGTGGNGNDVLVYAQAGLPTAAVPEPESYALLLAGLGLVTFVKRARKGA